VEARETTDAIQDELDFNLALRPLQARGNEQQEALRAQQVPSIRAQLEKLQQDVMITRNKLASLTVRAPVAGRVTALDLKVGESRDRGEHFGELTPDTGFKLSAAVDEFYLSRLRKDQQALVQIGSLTARLRVTRIYPQVKDGTFSVDFSFVGPPPPGLLPGQTLQGRVVLGDAVPALVLPTGAFLERSGGDWVFVLDPGARAAHRRRIKAGRRNVEQVEVLSGLEAGEQVITSDYAAYERIERIDIGP
jgi:HlyD family secretion protein